MGFSLGGDKTGLSLTGHGTIILSPGGVILLKSRKKIIREKNL
jgi:hypothetical protein